MIKMEWKTKISKFNEREEIIRNFKLDDLIGKITFSEMIFILLQGKKPTKEEAKLMDAILVATCEHGLNPPSTLNTRIAASSTENISQALASGILTIGKYHGGAIEGLARILQENKLKTAKDTVQYFVSKKERIPGYGHKIYKNEDPRTIRLLKIAKELSIDGNYIKLSLEIQKELEKQTKNKLCLNIDGCIAALISELKFNWRIANAFFILPRILGLTAHYQEELTEEKPYRRLDDYEVKYEGK